MNKMKWIIYAFVLGTQVDRAMWLSSLGNRVASVYGRFKAAKTGGVVHWLCRWVERDGQKQWSVRLQLRAIGVDGEREQPFHWGEAVVELVFGGGGGLSWFIVHSVAINSRTGL